MEENNNAVFDLLQPEQTVSPVIFASPHSGRDYEGTFAGRSVLEGDLLRSSEDVLVDRFIETGATMGVPVLRALAPRAFVDLNRSETDLDPAVIDGVPRTYGNPRVSAGLGVIARVVSFSKLIYNGKISREDAENRLKKYWYPYHQVLENLMKQQTDRHGSAILLDFHSMPCQALQAFAPVPEIVLGDRYGHTCAPWIVARVEEAFLEAGFDVRRNVPFAGAYIVQRYGRPHMAHHALQIEIARGLYQDSAHPYAETDKMLAFKARLQPVLQKVSRIRLAQELAAE